MAVSAGFIGTFLVGRLLRDGGRDFVGLCSVNGYYDPGAKENRLRMLRKAGTDVRFVFVCGDIADVALAERLFVETTSTA